MTLPSDATLVPLVRRAQAHDARAFDQLYDLFADLLFRYAYLSSGSAHLAETIVNDVFVALVGSIRSIRVPRRDLAHVLLRWLLDHASRLMNDARAAGGSSDGSSNRTLTSGGTERQLAPDYALAATIQCLAPEQQQVIVLRCVERLPLQDVVAITGQTAGVVKQLQHRALMTVTHSGGHSHKIPEAW